MPSGKNLRRKICTIITSSCLFVVFVKATVCPVKIDAGYKQGSTEYKWDARFISANISMINVTSAANCIHRCLKECLCYHANYKKMNATNWACEMVRYTRCGERAGVRITEKNDWTAVKLNKESEDPFATKYCCELKEPLESMLQYCSTTCLSMSRRVPQFGLASGDDVYRWRCYEEASALSTYYYSSGTRYCTRNDQVSAIINNNPDVASGVYKIGAEGQSCGKVCDDIGKVCSANLVTLNAVYHFHRLGIICKYNRNVSDCFTNIAHPVYYPNTGFCHGYINVPLNYDCATEVISDAQRLCKCIDP